jgi:hypothetical protein
MARQRISLVPDEVKQKATIEARIRSGEINPENFSTLSPEEQVQVNEILFKMASEKIEPNQGLSAVEFVLFGFMRIMNKKANGMALTEDELAIEASLNRISAMHDITNTSKAKSDWLFDYMGYAELKSAEFLNNRKEHIRRKQQVTGTV